MFRFRSGSRSGPASGDWANHFAPTLHRTNRSRGPLGKCTESPLRTYPVRRPCSLSILKSVSFSKVGSSLLMATERRNAFCDPFPATTSDPGWIPSASLAQLGHTSISFPSVISSGILTLRAKLTQFTQIDVGTMLFTMPQPQPCFLSISSTPSSFRDNLLISSCTLIFQHGGLSGLRSFLPST